MRRTKTEREEAKERLILTIAKGTPMPLSMCLAEILCLHEDLDDAEREIANVTEQQDKLLHVVRYVGGSLAQGGRFTPIPPIVAQDLAEKCNEINQELNLP